MKKIIAILAIITYFNASAQYDPKAKAILDKVSAKYKVMKGYQAAFLNNILSPAAEMDETIEGKISVSGEKFNLALKNQTIIVDGKTMWTIMKEEEEVNINDYEPEEGGITPQNIYSMYQKGYKYVYNSTVVEAGKKYDIVDLSPDDKNNEFFKIRIQIEQETNTIKSWKIFEKSGNRYTYTITSFKEVPSFPANTFSFDKSKYVGYDINDLR